MWIKNSLHWIYFVGNTYNRVYIWCCKYDENRYCERCANKWWCASKHTGLLNSCLGKWHLIPYLVVPLISARVPLVSTRVSAHCQAILFNVFLKNSHLCSTRLQNRNLYWIFLDEVGSDQNGGILSPFMGPACLDKTSDDFENQHHSPLTVYK